MGRVRNKKKIVELTYEWCCNKFGSPLKTKQYPALEIIANRNSRYSGEYSERVITINTALCKTRSSLIRVVIHEYTHFLQMPKLPDMKKYHDLFSIHGYGEHPMEIEAFNMELKHFRNCFKYLKRRKVF
jgi:hypothetical protein